MKKMAGMEVLELIYDLVADNKVSDKDRERLKEALDHVDYEHYKIVIGGNDLRIYDHMEED